MNVNQMIVALREEHAVIEDAIAVLERLASSGRRRRGRPPAWLAAGKPKRVFSPETKQRMAQAQRRRWAAFRKAKAQSD